MSNYGKFRLPFFFWAVAFLLLSPLFKIFVQTTVCIGPHISIQACPETMSVVAISDPNPASILYFIAKYNQNLTQFSLCSAFLVWPSCLTLRKANWSKFQSHLNFKQSRHLNAPVFYLFVVITF